MNTLNGYSKSTLTDMYALTAAGGHYPLLPSGYAYSSTAGLSRYWCRMLTCPIKHTNNDYDITLYVHSAYNNKRGFVHVRARLSTDLYVNLTQISGNLPLTAFRLYYNVDENNSAEIQLWCDCGVQWDVYNYKIISFTTRNSKETSFPGDLYAGNFSEAQTLPDWEYINLTQVYTPIMTEGKSYSLYNFQQYDANDQIPSYLKSDCAVINITSYKGWQPWIRAVDRDKGSWALGVNGTSVYLGYINKTNTSNNLTACWEFRSSSSTIVPGSILPISTNFKSLGSGSYRWDYLYTTYVDATNLCLYKAFSTKPSVTEDDGTIRYPELWEAVFGNTDNRNTIQVFKSGATAIDIGERSKIGYMYTASMIFASGDTYGYLSIPYQSAGRRLSYIGGGNKFGASGWCAKLYHSDMSLIPDITNTYDLGSSDNKWNKVYATSFEGNATSATKLTTSAGNSKVPVYFADGKPVAISYINESLITQRDSGSGLSMLEGVGESLFSANRLAYKDPNDITIEYSNDGGSTWLDYGADDNQKKGLCTIYRSDYYKFYLGKKQSGTTNPFSQNDMLRITIASNDRYFAIQKFLIYITENYYGSGAGVYVDTYRSTWGEPDTWITVSTNTRIRGWAGWNSIVADPSSSSGVAWGSSSSSTNTGYFRFVFKYGNGASSQTTRENGGAYIYNIFGYGSNFYSHTTKNTILARTGHLYQYDVAGNATFPGNIIPYSKTQQDLGTSDYQWNAIYGKTLYENGTSLTNKYAAKEHAHSNLTLTGPLVFNGNDVDRNVIRINCTNGDADNKSDYGFTLKYLGSGYGVNNALALYADNSQETEQNLATKWLNDGTMYSRSILPHANNTYDLGSSSLNWKTIYATTFTGHLDGTVSMIGDDANAYRDILVTNGSNGICYSLANNVQLNYSTGDVRATSFTGKLKKMIDSTQLAGYTREISNALCLDSHVKGTEIQGEIWGTGENNAILTISRYLNGNYSSQLGFTGNGLYYRTFNNKLPDTDTKFNKIVLENGGSWNISATKLSSKAIAFTPAETALTPDEVYALVDGTTIKRGTWSYAGNGYISNDTTGVGTIDLAGVTVIQADAGSSNQYTQLYLTSSTGSTEGYKPNEIFMYNKNSGYSPSWTRVLTNRNYTEYCLPLAGGTLTGQLNSQGIVPTSNNAYSLGTSNFKWTKVYATNVYATNLIGSLTDTSLTWKTRTDDLNCTNPSLISVASMSILSANRLQFARPAGIIIEYSTDGGTTWEDYGCADNEKINLVSGHSNIIKAGKGLSTVATSNDKLRITIHATNAGIYTRARALLINASTNGSISQGVSRILVDIETAPRSSEDNFTVSHTGLIISGLSGWNQIPLNGVSFGGGTTQTYNTGAIRLTFYSDGAASSYTSGAHFDVRDLYLIGDAFWNTPSTMAKTGHLYNYNYLQDMILPHDLIPETHNKGLIGWSNKQWAVIYANVFCENGTSLSEKYLGKNAQAASSVTSTKTGDGTNVLYAEQNNEINFGGTTVSDVIYFGYRAKDSKEIIPSSFVFGGSDGRSTITANGFKKKGSSSDYLLLGDGSHTLKSNYATIKQLIGEQGKIINGLDPEDYVSKYVSGSIGLDNQNIRVQIYEYVSNDWVLKFDSKTVDSATANILLKGQTQTIYNGTRGSKSKIVISECDNYIRDFYFHIKTSDSTFLSGINAKYEGYDLNDELAYTTTSKISTWGSWHVAPNNIKGLRKVIIYLNEELANSAIVIQGYRIYQTNPEINVLPGKSQSTFESDKLTTYRTLWGQSFDGTANVSGNMTNVGSITMSDALTLSGTTSSSAMISFSRTGANTWNYISWPGNSDTSCLLAFGYGNSSAKSYYYMSSAALYPASNNAKTLGTSDNKWSTVYATSFVGNLTGDVTGTSEYAKALVVTSAIGDSNTPVYINASGVPVACSYDVDSVKTTASSTNFYIAGSSSSSTTTGTLYKSANVKVQNGTAVYASGGFYESSDARLKNFGNDINIDLDKLVKIPKKYFTWKDDKNVTLQIGTSAQAVKELYPELVGEDENGVLSVAYDKLAIIALAAVDKLYELVKSLQANGKGN